LLGAIAILCCSLPGPWIGHILPGVGRPEWAMFSVVACFFWLIFRFRDPRIAILGAMGIIGLGCSFAPGLSHYAVQMALVSLLAHSLRWNDQGHKGAAMLRFLGATLWVLISCSWLFSPDHPEGLLVDSAAGVLLGIYLLHATIFRCRKHLVVPISASLILLSKPTTILGSWLDRETPGMLAVVGSFVLFALGSIAAFSKPKWWPPGPAREGSAKELI